MKKVLLPILLLLIAFTLNAEYISTSNMIDIPEAKVIGNFGLEINGNLTMPLATTAPDHVYYNMAATFGLFNKAQITLNYYTATNWSLSGRYIILNETANAPALALGISDLTYRKMISPVGGDSSGVLSDWNYANRPFENGSLFLVATKGFMDMLKLDIGIGRGRYVGYGPVSHYFNPSVFSSSYTTVSGDWYFGLFIGLEYKIMPTLYVNAEFDGRDANAGIRWKGEIMKQALQVGLAFTHLEQINSSSGNTPSINLSVTGKIGL